jgi:hypothetical protein
MRGRAMRSPHCSPIRPCCRQHAYRDLRSNPVCRTEVEGRLVLLSEVDKLTDLHRMEPTIPMLSIELREPTFNPIDSIPSLRPT